MAIIVLCGRGDFIMGEREFVIKSSALILSDGRGDFILGERVCNANSMPRCMGGDYVTGAILAHRLRRVLH